MKKLLSFVIVAFLLSCNNKSTSVDTQIDNSQQTASKDFREFKVLDSKYLNNSTIWSNFNAELDAFSEENYNNLKPFILEKDIPTIQKYVSQGILSYELLVKFYLYRIRKYDRENALSLNSVISLNPNVLNEAREADKNRKNANEFSVFGMPILLKDNINAQGMPTTAGAVALEQNFVNDAFIVNQLKANGALILGKANLSEWAYFFCGDCPSGYSAIGGQTLNPYGRRVLDTGGSSSGSGVAVAANFCVAAIGSETSGSILSPSSQNSVVGLKPTIGLLSRTGIVPISSTLDTPGPITKNVIDNAIVLTAMFGYDETDFSSVEANRDLFLEPDMYSLASLKGKRFGAFTRFLNDTLYLNALETLKKSGAEIVEIEQPEVNLPQFIRLLNLDMKKDLPLYLNEYSGEKVTVKSVQDVIDFNNLDSLKRAPYGQRLFKGIVADTGTETDLKHISDTLQLNGKSFFSSLITEHNLDGVLSINNFHAGFAAVAKYPAITVPMGYQNSGAPRGLTFIAQPFQENLLLQWAYVFEQASKARIAPRNYD
jgi:amidase